VKPTLWIIHGKNQIIEEKFTDFIEWCYSVDKRIHETIDGHNAPDEHRTLQIDLTGWFTAFFVVLLKKFYYCVCRDISEKTIHYAIK
jgi:hypothetical protein